MRNKVARAQADLGELNELFDEADHAFFASSDDPLAKQIRGLAYAVRDGGPVIVKTLLVLALQQYRQRKQSA